MTTPETTDLRNSWNRVAAHYQALHRHSTASAHYGPWAPNEEELRLLGDVGGSRILELGCGGGECCIAFARQGAQVTGLDWSEGQLDYARSRARQAQLAIQFVQGDAADLRQFAGASWEIVFSTYTFQYLTDLPKTLQECARVLVAGGRLVFSLDHPLRDCFFDATEHELSVYPARSYFDSSPLVWRFANPGVWMHTHHHTVGEWIDLLGQAGFRLQRLLEPVPPRELLDALWPEDDARAPLRCLPQTIIFVAAKSGQ